MCGGIYEKYTGTDTVVTVPDVINGETVTVIGAKAFLNCREITSLTLPDSVRGAEDWAFAHMKKLERLYLPAVPFQLGKKVFLGCDRLTEILPGREEQIYEGIPFFLASAVRMEAPELMTPEKAGHADGQWEWLQEYDRLLVGYLIGADDIGYEPGFVGWFDVEDPEDVKQRYMRERRKTKIGLLFQRLQYSEGLKEARRQSFADYLLGRVQPDVPSLFLELLQRAEGVYGRAGILKLWREIGGLKVLSADHLLEQLPDADPEIRAFLMDCRLDEGGSGEDFFSDFDL